jgi:hypothetical protein
MLAKMESNLERMKAKMDANQEKTEVCVEGRKEGPAKRDDSLREKGGSLCREIEAQSRKVGCRCGAS